MPGTTAAPSGNLEARANTEDVYICSNCRSHIALPQNQKLQDVCQLIQSHLQYCMPSTIRCETLPNVRTPRNIQPPAAEVCMPLQPRRTWSAEDERRRRLEEDPDAYDVGPHTVTCAGCHRPIRLNATGRYYAANWNKHKMGCKNTNAVNGAGAVSADSKFTGRVAAFRVAKPAESAEAHAHVADTSIIEIQQIEQTRTPSPGLVDLLSPGSSSSQSIREYENLNDGQAINMYTSGIYSHTRPLRTSLNSGLPREGHIPGHIHSIHVYPENTNPRMQPVISGSELPTRLSRHRISESPTDPSFRHEEQESFRFGSPFGEEHGQYRPISRSLERGGCLHAATSSSHHLRNNSETSRRLASLNLPRDVPTSMSGPDKGKIRQSGSHSHMLAYPRAGPPKWLASDYQVAPHRIASSPSVQQHRRIKDCLSPAMDSRTTMSSIIAEPGKLSSVSKFATHKYQVPDPSSSDSRTLPPLNSLSLSRDASVHHLARSLSEAPLFNTSRGTESSHISGITLPPLDLVRGHSWRERTLAWIQNNTPSEAESLDSVALPPIRAPSVPSPLGTKRRLKTETPPETNEMDVDRPSLPKVFVLPKDSSAPTTTITTEDSTLKFSYTRPSSMDIPSMGEGSGSGLFTQESTVGISISSEPAPSECEMEGTIEPRLHPVWKWEQKNRDGFGATPLRKVSSDGHPEVSEQHSSRDI